MQCLWATPPANRNGVLLVAPTKQNKKTVLGFVDVYIQIGRGVHVSWVMRDREGLGFKTHAGANNDAGLTIQKGHLCTVGRNNDVGGVGGMRLQQQKTYRNNVQRMCHFDGSGNSGSDGYQCGGHVGGGMMLGG